MQIILPNPPSDTQAFSLFYKCENKWRLISDLLIVTRLENGTGGTNAHTCIDTLLFPVPLKRHLVTDGDSMS